MAKQFTLSKNERLKSRKLIEQLFRKGRSFAIAPFKIYYILTLHTNTGSSSNLQFGVGAGTKNFKKAVDRNRIKRLTREAYRLQKNSLLEKLKENGQQLNVFFIYTGKELPSYENVYEKIKVILKRLIEITGIEPGR